LICATILFFPGGIIQLVDWIDRKLVSRKKQA
jgi:hypothetical protein